MFKSVGTVNYRRESVVLEVDPQISFYYQWLLSKEGIRFNKPMYPAHITIIRKGEVEIHDTKYQDNEVEFSYNPGIRNDELFFWLSVETNERFEKIRLDYGLDWCYDKKKYYHMTIGNMKGLV